MPSKTEKQREAMAIACHHPKKSTAKIPKKVACEFNAADKAKKKTTVKHRGQEYTFR